MGKSGDPEGEASNTLNTTLSKPKDPKMQAAKVHMLNGTTKDFELHRGSDGDVLFTMASIDLSIEEREYFSLCFYDDQDLRHWLYNDKKILRQLKGLPWEFSFEVKFYPTAPATLNDDNARCTLFLQLRKDVASGRLPATIPTLALLGALVAQAEYGDVDSTAEYERYLRDSLKVPNLKDQTQLNELLEKVKELHREQKGLTASEAESKYLDACKQLSMYGVFIFDAKDNDNNKVGIGICATGINIYKETIRVHRFAWQNIVKISYKKNSFSIKLKAGEMDKKETTLHYKVHDYLHAKRVWKCGVEHHTFFRLIQPEDKPKGGLFRWGSTRFRYQGRTQFQTKMASQMFDQSQGGTVPRAARARLTQSCDHGLNKENIPVHDKSATLGRDGQPESPVTSPGVSYDISSAKRAGTTNGKVGTALDGDELVYTPVESPTSAAYYLSERSSLRSPYSSGAVSPNDWSAWGRDVSWRQTTTARRNLFGRQNDSSVHLLRIVKFGDEQPGVTSTARSADLEQIPIQQSVALYHRGFYTEPPREPTVRIQHYAPRNGHHPVERLQPLGEMEQHPIRFFVNLHHSGMTDRVRISRVRHSGVEEVADAVPENYVFPVHETSHTHILPRNPDLPPQCLLEHVDVYYDGDASTPPKMQKYRLVARVMPQLRPAASPPTVNGHQVQTYQAIQQRPYRGPLETTDRRDDLANLPLENQPRVRYVSKSTKAVAATVTSGEPIEEPQRVRYIARIRHEGAEEIVEKDQVQPELYGLPSTSYEGPLEDTSRQDDLELLPIEDHAKIYHSGQSWIKAKPPTPVKEHPEPKEAKKKAILHVKGTEAEEEKPQIRVLARIQPSEVNEETVREPSPGLFGFLKTTGRKTRTVSNESSMIAAYPSSSEAYQGPLDTVDRREDLARLPLEQQPRVPYVSSPTKPIKEVAPEPVEEVRNVRYIARIRHEGEEEIVEKDQVQPELYGLPSTSYEGPLEDTSRQDDLELLPIEDHAKIYHSGQSWIKAKPPTPVKEHPEPKEAKKKAILHVKATEEEKPEPEIRILARIKPAEVVEVEPVLEKVPKAREPSAGLFGFLKSSGKKAKTTKDESKAALAYPSTSESYEGPLDSTDRRDDLASLPLAHQPQIPYVSKSTQPIVADETAPMQGEEIGQVRYIARIRHEGEEETVEKDQVKPELYGLPSTSYEGPLEDTSRQDDLQHLPIQDHAEIYHSGQSWTSTKLPSPIKESPKKKAVLHVKSTPQDEKSAEVRVIARIQPAETAEELPSSEEQSKARESTSSLFGFLKSAGRKRKSTSIESSTAVPYLAASERYEGPVDTVDRHDDLANLPLDHQPRVPYVSKLTKATTETTEERKEEVRPVRYIARIRHEGEEEIVEKDQVQPELYGLPSTSYEGPLEDTSRQDDLELLPIEDHAKIYHSGQSWIKAKPPTPVKEHPEPKETKKKAILHVKGTEAEEEKPQIRVLARIQPSEVNEETVREPSPGLFGFLKTTGRKTRTVSNESSTIAAYPSSSEAYQGPLDTVDRREDLARLPLEQQPRVLYVSSPTKPIKEVAPEPVEEVRNVRYIARIRHEGEEEIVEKDQVQPELYGLPSTSYEGPLEDTSRQDDLELLPIEDHAKIYHSGQSWIKAKPPTPVKEHPEPKEAKKKAILHVKATEEEKPEPEIRILARIKPAEVVEVEPVLEKVPKAREPSAGLFGFLKSSGKKAKTTKDESKAALAYPSTSESYEGPLDSTDRRDDLASLPLAHQPQIPYVSKSTQPIVADETAPMQGEEIGQVRYIARIRHEGEEETVEKDQVKPELYGLPSTSYEGPLEDTSRQDDLQHLPIQDHAEIYHSGQSWTSTKLPSPIKESPKKKAVLHVKSTPQDEKSAEVRVIARIQPAETAEELPSSEEQSKARESTSSLFGFLKSAGRKRKSTSIESSTAVPYLAASERYEGPVDTVDRHDDLANLPLDHQPRVPYVSKLTKATTETTEERKEEVRPVRYIARIRHEGEEEIVEKDQVQPELYGLPSTSYEGPLEDTSRQDDLELLPIEDHAKIYHSGQSWIKAKPPTPVKEHPEPKEAKKKAILHVKATEEEKPEPEIRILARIKPAEVVEVEPFLEKVPKAREPSAGLFGFLKSSGKKAKTTEVSFEVGGRHFSSSDAYHTEGTTIDGQQWTEIRVERRVEVQLEPVFCLTGAGLGAVSEDEAGLIFTATPAPMAPDRRSFLSRLGFKSKKSKKSKGEHEADSSDSSSSDEEHRVKVVPVVESLSTTIAEAERLNQRSPRLEHAERTITVRALAPLPVSFEESGQPHTTVASWQETTLLPDNVTVEYDDKGNRITRTVKTSQVKHTVQKQTFQNYTVPDETDPSSTVERSREQMTPLGLSTHTGPVVDTKTRSVVYEASSPSQGGTESVGEFVSSKTVTSGNRTIETITYKTERDGIIETHVEHRVTIHSDLPIDHDAELSAAIAEATQMNPDMTVEKIEVRQETST